MRRVFFLSVAGEGIFFEITFTASTPSKRGGLPERRRKVKLISSSPEEREDFPIRLSPWQQKRASKSESGVLARQGGRLR